MNDLEYIDDYFVGRLSPTERKNFDKRIVSDPSFANTVAFYLDAIKAAEVNIQTDRRALHREWMEGAPVVEMRTGGNARVVSWMSAAAVLLIAFLLWFLMRKPESTTLAQNYAAKHFSTLPVTMGTRVDSLQLGAGLYNEGKFADANNIYKALYASDSTNWQSLEYAGLCNLSLKRYDAAALIFSQLERKSELASNPGTFLHALALLLRNNTGDANEARILLQKVVDRHLQYEKDAQEILQGL